MPRWPLTGTSEAGRHLGGRVRLPGRSASRCEAGALPAPPDNRQLCGPPARTAAPRQRPGSRAFVLLQHPAERARVALVQRHRVPFRAAPAV
ncbi:MAG: hypothetical protein F4184_09905 [Gemmatimonadetes bacterium]|nr:hypothetical protein [Gemmatimonadota bacterium]